VSRLPPSSREDRRPADSQIVRRDTVENAGARAARPRALDDVTPSRFYLGIAGPLGATYLVVGAALRVWLWASPGGGADLGWTGLPIALAIGLVNDLAELVYLFVPLSLVLLVLPVRLLESSAGRLLVGLALYACVVGLLFVAVAELVFFDEFQARFNLVAVDYLIYPTEVIGNIEESYPLYPTLAGVAAGGLVVLAAIWRRARIALRKPPSWRFRLAVVAANALAAGAVAFATSSDTLALRVNPIAGEISMNGASTFFRALRTAEIDYHQFYRTLPRRAAFRIVRRHLASMGGTFVSSDPISLVRRFPPKATGLGKLNVVVLTEESLGAQYVGAYGDTHGLTPHLDALAKDGLLFRNAYATGARTVRGLEAMSASFPPIPSESIIKRPGCEDISNWGRIMRENGYQTSFLYGGFGAFDNMNHYFGGNGFSLSDRLDIERPEFTNIWGVSDEDLFHHAVEYFDDAWAAGSPFFSLVMSTSNHKPFTFPPGIPGVPERDGGRAAGVRYADYALGRFFAEARTHRWFSHTLFVVIADHDSRVYGSAEVPVEHYRIPALLYAPGRLAAGVATQTFSNMDLAPTVLGLLGIGYSAPFYGVDVLDPAVPADRPVLFSHNHDVAIFADGKLSVLGLRKEARSFRYANGKTTEVPVDHRMVDLLTAYLQTAYELFQAHRY
jgi:phosphoglycerol transferase MdoB-like AlkP superfamily enzyme